MHPSTGLSRRPAAWKVIGGLTIIGLVLGLAGAGLMAVTGSGAMRPRVDLSEADAEAAYAACQRFVREQAKAPGPLTFAPLGWRTARRFVDGRYRVRSHARAANQAGHLVDIRVACIIRPLGGDRWQLEDLSVTSD
jgi:hypothetical protein